MVNRFIRIFISGIVCILLDAAYALILGLFLTGIGAPEWLGYTAAFLLLAYVCFIPRAPIAVIDTAAFLVYMIVCAFSPGKAVSVPLVIAFFIVLFFGWLCFRYVRPWLLRDDPD